jgi:hypothetical protein
MNTFPLQRTRDATVDELLETVFPIGSAPRLYSYSILAVEEARAGECVSELVRISEKNEERKISTQSYRSKLHVVNSRPSPVWCNQCE